MYETAQIKSGTCSDITVTCVDEKDNKVDFKCHKLIIFPFLSQSCLLTSDEYEDIEHMILPDVSPNYFKKFLNYTFRKLEYSNEDYFAFFSSKHVVVSQAANVKVNDDDGGGGGNQGVAGEGVGLVGEDLQNQSKLVNKKYTSLIDRYDDDDGGHQGDGGEGGGLVVNDLQNPSRSIKKETSLLEKHKKKIVEWSLWKKEKIGNKEPIKSELIKEETTEEITEEKNLEKITVPLKTDIVENALFQCTFCTEAFPKTKIRNKHMIDIHYSELEEAGRIFTTEGGKKTRIKWYHCDFDYEVCDRYIIVFKIINNLYK